MADIVTKAECAEHHRQLMETLAEIKGIALSTHGRLFVDNGTPCIQSKVGRHELVISGLIWVVGVLLTAVVGVVVKVMC